MKSEEGKPILFFDGVCNLCNNSVQFIIKHDKKAVFRFASLQSEAWKRISKDGDVEHNMDTVVLYHNGKFYTRSSAVVKSVSLLGGGWKLINIGYLIPSFLRNKLYDLIASKRYKWFGTGSCMVPTPELKSRFLEG